MDALKIKAIRPELGVDDAGVPSSLQSNALFPLLEACVARVYLCRDRQVHRLWGSTRAEENDVGV